MTGIVAVCAIAAGIAFAVTVALGIPGIALLRRLSFRQTAYEDAPKTHAVKSGTPTMGGLLFIPVPLVLGLVAAASGPRFLAAAEVVGFALACAAIGFADDYASIVRGRNRGLRGKTKFVLTALAGVAFLGAIALSPQHVDTSLVGFGGFTLGVPPLVWYALSLAAILSTTHAVNLTDGLDGLAAGTMLPPLALFVWIATLQTGNALVEAVLAAVAGSVLGFLVFNRHPARVFMGDTGSLFLGGMLAGGAILLDQQLLLPIVGGVFAAEALSVILQVAYFKRTKKRIFKMSPLHHHFELSGWPETKVTAWFWAASLGLSLVGFAFARVGIAP